MYFETSNLSVGYLGKVLIHDINLSVEKGKIVTLIGPNGSGKSTILKTITRQLEEIAGTIVINQQNMQDLTDKEIAKKLSVMLTERIDPDLMNCEQVVSMGRYPYTNYFGTLTKEDKKIVYEALEMVHAKELAERPFTDISDGQRQRIMLARAICQQPEILVLDEPTSYLDIRHKIELLDILRKLATERNVAVVMSLHEIDLAAKVSDEVICIKGEEIKLCGTPEHVFSDKNINTLYDLKKGAFNTLFGSVELMAPEGEPKAFVLAGNGKGIPIFRFLQKKKISFSTGILFENDVDLQIAKMLSKQIITIPAFSKITQESIENAKKMIDKAEYVIDTQTLLGEQNEKISELKKYIYESGKKCITTEELWRRN